MASVENLTALKEAIQNCQEKNAGVLPFSFGDSISFNQVSFSYSESSPVFRDLSFRIKKGEMIGLVGPSGSGKTTIADLFIRLMDPTQGKILLDGKDLREFSISALREGIGYVSQDPFLLHTSIEENIRFYHPNMSIEGIFSAAKDAQIYDFVNTLPEKFHSAVGDRGMMLSGGQRQRIALARVLARSPKILILDEATSALDNESENLIQKAIRSLKGRVTIIIIAHRLSTIVDLDRVLVLNKGVIVEEGSPSLLLKNPGSRFYQMYHLSLQR
jgi:ABC-type multidrug transport system fused ATPase/permease subunit